MRSFKEDRLTIEVITPSQLSRSGRLTVLNATAYLDTADLLVSYVANGSAVRALDNSQLSSVLLQNPSWTDEQATRWLAGRGPAISAAELASRLAGVNMASFKSFLGKQVAFAPPVLLWRQDRPDSAGTLTPFRAKPVWAVEARALLPNGREASYRVEFEPFVGHLVAVLRR